MSTSSIVGHVNQIKSQLSLLLPDFYSTDNPLLKINWMTDKLDNNAINFLPKVENIMEGNEPYNSTSRFPIFLNGSNLVCDEGNLIFQESGYTIRKALLQLALQDNKLDLFEFDKKYMKQLKDFEYDMNESELHQYLGSTSKGYINNPSINARTGGSIDLAMAISKFSDSADKEVSKIYEKTLIVEFGDVIPNDTKEELKSIGNKFTKLHNDGVRLLLKLMNEEMKSQGNLLGLESKDIEVLLEHCGLRYHIIDEALELGIITRSYNNRLRPHHHYLDI